MKATKKTPNVPATKRKAAVAKPGKASVTVRGVESLATVDLQPLLSQAVGSIESMERLLALRDKMKAEWAREQFFTALAGFQRDCPIIGKDRTAKIKSKKGDESSFSYKYAPLETIIAAVQPVLERWGFSWTCKPTQVNGNLKAEVHAHHKDGHEEVTVFEIPLDPNSYMSAPQQAAAASTFARRYAFINAFGITTKGEDNDGADGEPPRGRHPITEPRATTQTRPTDAPVPVQHEERAKPRTFLDTVQHYLMATEADPKSKLSVALFTENERIDYMHNAREASGNIEEEKIVLDDIIATGKKRRAAIKGE